MRDSLPEVGWFMLPPANVGERPRTGPVDCLVSDYNGVQKTRKADEELGSGQSLIV